MASSRSTTTALRKRKNGVHPTSQLGGLIDGAEALVAATADLGEEKVAATRESLKAELEAAREQLERLEIDASALLALLRRPLFELTRREMARDARSILEIVS